MGPSPRALGALGLTVLAAACSGATAHNASPSAANKAAAASPTAPPPYETPAHWEVYPSPRGTYATAQMRLADGGCILTDQSGQRWRTAHYQRGPITPAGDGEPSPEDEEVIEPEPEPQPVFVGEQSAACEGRARAAIERAPEPLAGIVRWASSYAFVGVSGTLHEAASPLGRFTRRIPPPEPLVRVRGAGNTVLAVTATGRLLRWDEEAGYQRVDLEGRHAFDLAVSPAGGAVVLAAPEAVFVSEDGGKRFTRAAAPPIGARRVGHPPGGPFILEGAVTSHTWDPRQPATFTKSRARIPDDPIWIPVSPGPSPSGSLVTQGRAALDGDQYWEIGVAEYGEWVLYRGKLGRSLTRLPIDVGSTEDGNVLVAARGRHVALVNIGWGDDGPTVRARISHDGAASFEEPIPFVMSELSPLGVAMSADGVALFTGLCTVDEMVSAEECGGGPLVARSGAPPAPPRGAHPQGPAIAPAFSPDGRSAYFLGPHGGDGHLALFVSHDAGASFESRNLDLGDGDTIFEAQEETAVTVSENGTVGLLLEASGELSGTAYVTASADGRDVHARSLPPDVEIAGVYGDRALAIARRGTPEEPDPHLRETLDGGLTWPRVHGPSSLRDSYARRGDIACSSAGCLLGDEVARIGWGGRSEPPLPFQKVAHVPPPAELRTPITCEPRSGSTWTRIDHVPEQHRFPDEHDAARGRAAWSLPTFDPQTGAVGTVTATLPQNGEGAATIVPRTLLGPTPKGKLFAVAIRPQIEGLAAARVELDAAAVKVGVPAWTRRRLKDLEVAWENLEEGTTGRVVLPDGGSFQPYSVYGTAQIGFTLVPEMLSVSPGGIFVRGSDQDPTAYFVDSAGKVKAFRYPDALLELLDGALLDAGDAIHVDGTFVPSSQIGGDSVDDPEVLLLHRPPPGAAARSPAAPAEPWVSWAMTIAPGPHPQDGRITHSDWTYEGGHLAVWAMHLVPDAGHATAWMSRVLQDGTLAAPARLPTPYDLPRTPRPCTAAEHRDLPRVKMPLEILGRGAFPGTRHPVLVTEIAPSDPSPAADPKLAARPAAPKPTVIGRASLLATGYVLRGTPASPCIDAIAARSTDDHTAAALLTGDLRHGWYFRSSAGGTPAGRAIEVRPLTCRFDPGATVPTSVLEANARR